MVACVVDIVDDSKTFVSFLDVSNFETVVFCVGCKVEDDAE